MSNNVNFYWSNELTKSFSNFSIRKNLPVFAGIWGSITAQVLIIVGVSLSLKGLTELSILKAGLIIWLLGWVYTGVMIVGSWSCKGHKKRLPDEKVVRYIATPGFSGRL